MGDQSVAAVHIEPKLQQGPALDWNVRKGADDVALENFPRTSSSTRSS